MKRISRIFTPLLLLAAAAGLLAFPLPCTAAAREGLNACWETVVPSLFPFFVLSSLTIACGAADAFRFVLEPWMRPLFGVSGAGAGAFVLGLIGGYPVGARTVAELYRARSIDRREAERLLCFCNNAGPGFLLGVCGGQVFGSARMGLLLYLVHVAAALFTGMLLCRGEDGDAPRQPRRVPHRTLGQVFPAAVQSAFAGVGSVCGFVVLFWIVLRLLEIVLARCGITLDGTARSLLFGFFELTNGVISLPQSRAGFLLCAVFLGWGGLSVQMQTAAVLADTDLSLRCFRRGKLLQAALSLPLAYLVSLRLF